MSPTGPSRTVSSPPTRASIPTTIRLEAEAKDMLKEMCTSKSMGSLLSALIRGEWVRRREKERLRRMIEVEVESVS